MIEDKPPTFWAEVASAIGGSVIFMTAFWGALGGATNALVVQTTMRDAIRHIALGGVVATGMGGLGAPLVAHWLRVDIDLVSVAGVGAGSGTLAYLTGVIVPAILEAAHRRAKSGAGHDKT